MLCLTVSLNGLPRDDPFSEIKLLWKFGQGTPKTTNFLVGHIESRRYSHRNEFEL